MTTDPLHQPLGLPGTAGPARRPRPLLWAGLIGLAVLAGLAAVGLARLDRRATPSDVAIVPIETAPKPPAAAPAKPPDATPTGSATPNNPGAAMDGGSVEIQHGVKVIRLGTATSPGSVAIPVPDRAGLALKPAPDPRLVETTRLGVLPRIAAGGARPAEVYAAPATNAQGAAASAPRIALVARGMGLRQLETAELSRVLPPAVTFAFPPDGPDLPEQAAETRAAGHEIVLELPASLGEARTADRTQAGEPVLDRLHRAMSRFTGYAGVSYPSGAGSQDVVLGDVERRGLYALDATVSAPAGTTAPRPGPRRVDVAIPANAVQAALDQLVRRAQANGSAVGWVETTGNADRIAGFASALARQGIALVPLSAIADPVRPRAADGVK